MRIFVVVLAAGAVLSAPAFAVAFDQRTQKVLQKLEPETRFNQICDIETMARIRKDATGLKPERMVLDALRDPVRTGDTLTGTGAAVRSGDEWYQLSFECRATPDRMKVVDLSYKIGAAIPERDWERYGLWK